MPVRSDDCSDGSEASAAQLCARAAVPLHRARHCERERQTAHPTVRALWAALLTKWWVRHQTRPWRIILTVQAGAGAGAGGEAGKALRVSTRIWSRQGSPSVSARAPSAPLRAVQPPSGDRPTRAAADLRLEELVHSVHSPEVYPGNCSIQGWGIITEITVLWASTKSSS